MTDWHTRDSREERCKTLIERCGYAAAALTIIPIPGSEVIGVMPLHVGMVIGVGEEYGKTLTKDSAVELISRIGATVGLSLVGSRIAMTAGKLILPGLGGLVAAPFMFASTLAIGTVARLYFASDGDLSARDMKRAYDDELKRAKAAFDPSRARSSEARARAEDAVKSDPGAAADAPSEAPPTVDELADRLAKLDELREKGLVDDAEYERTKARILDSL
ncbi:MAG: SHOCT domain-containing protein [Sandaracinaceae bacterium]|nr:SHOCT domain-containing protein [Sandaracinaceae bacterium]